MRESPSNGVTLQTKKKALVKLQLHSFLERLSPSPIFSRYHVFRPVVWCLLRFPRKNNVGIAVYHICFVKKMVQFIFRMMFVSFNYNKADTTRKAVTAYLSSAPELITALDWYVLLNL